MSFYLEEEIKPDFDFDYEKVGAFKTKFFDNLDGNSSKRVADEILKTVRGEI